MKTIKIMFIMLLFLAGVFSACKPDKEEICDCFKEQGVTNQEALIGAWEFEAFGYTVNGGKIKEKEKIKQGGITFQESGDVDLWYYNEYVYKYTINNINEINITGCGCPITFMDLSQEEWEIAEHISKSFLNSICYKIENEKLYIHTKKLNGCNVLILKKRSSL